MKVELPIKLTRPQQRVMEYLKYGHRAYRYYASVVYVNGGKICTVATMAALEDRKLVERVSDDEWVATDLGKAVR